MKILVIRLSSIGEIILCTPLLRCIKTQIENSVLHFVTDESYKNVTESNPYIDKFFYFNKYPHNLIEELLKEDYDMVIDLQKNDDSIAISYALKQKTFSINTLNFKRFSLTNFLLNLKPKKHLALRNLDKLNHLNIQDDGKGLDYFIPKKDVVTENDLPTSHVLGFICITIGSSQKTKELSYHQLQELCIKIDFPIILLGEKKHKEIGDKIASVDNIKIYNSCGKFNLNETADLIKKSKLVITHDDTGLQYIAYAFNKQAIVIWGSKTSFLHAGPFYGSRFLSTLQQLPYEYVKVSGRLCRSCRKSKKTKCPMGHFKCMEEEDIDRIVASVKERLNLH